MPDDGGMWFIAATDGDRVVLTVNEHGIYVTVADANSLHGDHLAALIAMRDSGEPGANKIANTVEALAHKERLAMERGWRRVSG